MSDLPGPLANNVTVRGTTTVGQPVTVTATATSVVSLEPSVSIYLPTVLGISP